MGLRVLVLKSNHSSGVTNKVDFLWKCCFELRWVPLTFLEYLVLARIDMEKWFPLGEGEPGSSTSSCQSVISQVSTKTPCLLSCYLLGLFIFYKEFKQANILRAIPWLVWSLGTRKKPWSNLFCSWLLAQKMKISLSISMPVTAENPTSNAVLNEEQNSLVFLCSWKRQPYSKQSWHKTAFSASFYCGSSFLVRLYWLVSDKEGGRKTISVEKKMKSNKGGNKKKRVRQYFSFHYSFFTAIFWHLEQHNMHVSVH